MKRIWSRWPVVAAISAALLVQGCERSEVPTELLLAPQVAQSAAVTGPQKVPGSLPSQAAAQRVQRVIGADGGMLEHAGHRLTVPAGAVSGPTLFSLKPLAEGYVEVELKATSNRAQGRENDVGAEGFSKPLTLELTYSGADTAVQPERLTIVWVRGDGSLQVLPSRVDAVDQTITAELEHFSRYAVASN